MGSANGTPHKKRKSASKDVLPATPRRTHTSRYPLSSPYSGKSPLPMPILLPSQYSIGRSSERPSSGRLAEGAFNGDRRQHGGRDHEYGPATRRRDGVGSDKDEDEKDRDDDDNDGEFNSTARMIELFDKGPVKEQPEIPPVGAGLEQMPFFDKCKAGEYVSTLRGIHRQANSLKRINDTVVDLNESLGAYLFGLFQNAWCVNLNENVTPATLDKLEEVKRLTDEVADMEKRVEDARRSAALMEQRHKSTMPPPSVPRFQRNYTRKSEPRASGPSRIAEQRNAAQQQQQEKKRKFLRAGARNATFRERALMNRRGSPNDSQRQQKLAYGKGLNLSYATKIQNVPSLDDNSLLETSDSDTSEVKTLTSIMRLRTPNSYRGGDGGLRAQENTRVRRGQKEKKPEPWEVQHRKPFR